MRAIMRLTKPLSGLLVVALLGAAIPYRPAQAELVVTDSVIAPARRPESDRARVRALLDRREVQEQLEQYGISAEEAAARVDALTDQEIALIADRLNEVPAGGGVAGAFVWALVVLGFCPLCVVVAAVVVVCIVALIVNLANPRPTVVKGVVTP